MHPAAMKGFTANLEALPGSFRHGGGLRVLDLGGQDVNGTVHEVVKGYLDSPTVDVLDIEDGRGVTIVGDAREITWWTDLDQPEYDLVISTEMLEHLDRWPYAARTAKAVLRPGGWFVGTCASVGRGPHGATGAPLPAAGEYYQNVDPGDLTGILRFHFTEVYVQYEQNPAEPTTCDVYWRARKGTDR
jgi:SAM-dependent methyltransferase